MNTEQSFVVENDYTLSVVTTRKLDGMNGFAGSTVITRTFNFLAQQVTTHVRDVALGNSGGYRTGGAGSLSTALEQQHFDEFRSDAEIRLMHAQLKDKGGNPPPIEEVTRGMVKKSAVLSSPGKG